MTMFNSQKINNDPKPWVNPADGDRVSNKTRMGQIYFASPWAALQYKKDPRPEYDNNPNPILVSFRADTQEMDELAPNNARAWIGGDQIEFFEEGGYDSAWTDHARKVLQRLANLTTETE